jgi:hypothetical protein
LYSGSSSGTRCPTFDRGAGTAVHEDGKAGVRRAFHGDHDAAAERVLAAPRDQVAVADDIEERVGAIKGVVVVAQAMLDLAERPAVGAAVIGLPAQEIIAEFAPHPAAGAQVALEETVVVPKRIDAARHSGSGRAAVAEPCGIAVLAAHGVPARVEQHAQPDPRPGVVLRMGRFGNEIDPGPEQWRQRGKHARTERVPAARAVVPMP